MDIRDIQDVDIVAITEIYNRYIELTTITFEEVPISVSEMGERVNKIRAAGLPWLVVAHEGTVVGYAYTGQWNARSAYRYTVEPSIYLSPHAKGKGWGRAVYQVLLSKLKDLGIRNVLGVSLYPMRRVSVCMKASAFAKWASSVRSDINLSVGFLSVIGNWRFRPSNDEYSRPSQLSVRKHG